MGKGIHVTVRGYNKGELQSTKQIDWCNGAGQYAVVSLDNDYDCFTIEGTTSKDNGITYFELAVYDKENKLLHQSRKSNRISEDIIEENGVTKLVDVFSITDNGDYAVDLRFLIDVKGAYKFVFSISYEKYFWRSTGHAECTVL
jgi:hypothetical protein